MKSLVGGPPLLVEQLFFSSCFANKMLNLKFFSAADFPLKIDLSILNQNEYSLFSFDFLFDCFDWHQ